SSFHPLQVVAPNTLANYTGEVLRLTAGCAVEATGIIAPSPAKGQPFEMQADGLRVIGWVDDPDGYPIQPKPHTLEFLREVAHLRPRTNVIGAVTRVRHTIAQSIHRFFHDHGFLWINTDHHLLRCGRCGRAFSRVHARFGEPAPRATGQDRFHAGFLWPRDIPDGLRTTQRGGVLPRAVQGLHVRSNLPRREFEHEQASRRILDDRAGNRLCRPW